MSTDGDLFTWPEIEQDWLAGGALALPPLTVVQAFNNVAERFGRAWVEASRASNNLRAQGISPALHIVTLGQHLVSLDDAINSDGLLNKLRDGLPDARAELTAIHLVRSGASRVELELEPPGLVAGSNRTPDFRIRQFGNTWTCLEVKQASTSNARILAENGLKRLTTDLIEDCTGSFALEVFFRREPTPREVEQVAAQIISLQSDGDEETELADGLGSLYWNGRPPGSMELDDHGEPRTRIGRMATAIEAGVIQRDIVARWPFADARAQAFLDSAVKQLPTNTPGLIMVDTSGALGAMKTWRAVIERRFQPSIYTRVSGVCLFSSGIHLANAGFEWRPETQLIRNPYASIALPNWVSEQVERFAL